MRLLRTIAIVALAAGTLPVTFGCLDSGVADSGAERAPDDAASGKGDFAPGDAGSGGRTPEQEEEFEFSAPAVVGDSIFVANETLNSVAVIDSNTLSIDTVLAGSQPTEVVGPDPAFADSDTARVMVLNEGNSSVTVIDPTNQETTQIDVMPRANTIEMDPTGQYAIVWHDRSSAQGSDKSGDLAAVTVVTKDTAHQVSVGFHVRDVFFAENGGRALVWTDDGVSEIDLTSLSGDAFAPPISLVPTELDVFQPDDLEIKVTADTEYVITRSTRMRGIVLLDLTDKTRHVVPLFEVPTDVDLIGGDTPRILTMLRASDRAVRADIPEGLHNAADELSQYADDVPVTQESGTNNLVDMQAADAGDTGTSDADVAADDSGTDTDDAGDTGDTGNTGDTGDAGDDTPPMAFPTIDKFDVLEVTIDNLGAATVGEKAESALLYTTVQEEKRVVLLDLTNDDQRVVALRKKVRGAISDRDGDTFIIYNQKQPGEVPPGAGIGDEEYVERHWGVTLLDIESVTTKLILLDHEPGPTALWSPEQGDAKVYFTFKPPTANTANADPGVRDVVEANLTTFRRRVHRLPSIPEGLGPIQPAGKVFVSQRHPQGRMTFIDVQTADRQTITGYQLNSKIQ